MTLRELYCRYVELIDFFLQKANATANWEVRDSFRRKALDCQNRAGHIAHCIALFGDKSIEDIDFSDLKKQVEDKACTLENPWMRGISALQLEITSQA